MTKINMSGSNVGAKGICAVIDANGTVLPCLATDNGDGTATLKIDGEFTAAIDPGLLATEANQVTAQTSLDSIDTNTDPASVCTHASVTLTIANTEYSYVIPEGVKKLAFRAVDSTKLTPGSDIRYAFVEGKVATPTLPFFMLDGGATFSENELKLSGKILYLAGIIAGDIVLVEVWT